MVLTELRISHSSLVDYLQCRYRYYLGRVLRIKAPSKPLAPVIGVAVHAGIEAYYRNGPQTPRTALQKAWTKEVALADPAELAADPGALADADKMLAVYIANRPVAEPRYIETPFLFRLDGAVISGTIDVADEDLHDTKSRGGKTINGKKPSAFDPERHRLQMTLYALGYRTLAGVSPRRLLLDVVSRAGKFRQYEVQPDWAGTREVVALTAGSILAGHYEPTGAQSGQCFYCPYKNVCQHSTAREP